MRPTALDQGTAMRIRTLAPGLGITALALGCMSTVRSNPSASRS